MRLQLDELARRRIRAASDCVSSSTGGEQAAGDLGGVLLERLAAQALGQA